MPSTDTRPPVLPGAALFWGSLCAVLGVTAFAYWRGLNGAFLFDDFANLPALGAFGPVDNWTAFWRYITSGTADPTGRPLALLSFLIDAHDWPADPYPFKRTSLILHLVNGALLALLLRRLGRALDGARPVAHVDLAALLGAALWLLHPLFVSTTLYVVQREAMLPTTFTLLGLLGFCRGRAAAADGRATGVWFAAMSIAGCTLLAVASKANGVLLPLLAWLVDAIVLSRGQPIPTSLRTHFAWMRRVALIVPSLLLLAWLVSQGVFYFIHGVSAVRTWTLGERLLTEARIVCDYLSLLWLPHPYTAGLFNDAIVVSKGLLTPPTTLPAIAFLAALLTAGIALRRRAPALSLAVLFFFAGHLLESSVIPLELYYEHRNYLPAMLMFWPLARWLSHDGALRFVRRLLVVALPLLLASMTFFGADLWGNAQDQALVWAEKNPRSPRAQAYAAAADRARGRPDLAALRTRNAQVAAEEDIQVALNLIGAQCELGEVTAADLERVKTALRATRTAGQLYYDWISEAIRQASGKDPCKGLDVDAINALLAAMDENPNSRRYAGWRQDNQGLRGTLALAQREPKVALAWFDRALDERPSAQIALGQAAKLGAAGFPDEALEHLNHYDRLAQQQSKSGWSMARLHAWLLFRQGFMQSELVHLRSVLEQDVRDAKGKPQ